MNDKKLWAALLILSISGLMLTPYASAASVYARTKANFNIESSLSILLQLPGESNVTLTGSFPGADTTDIEFNTTSATSANVDAQVVGGTAQESGVPIFLYYNTGTINANVTISLNASMPACIALQGGTTYGGISTTITTGQTTVATNLAPGANQAYYLQADFTSCTAGDSTSRYVYSNATG